MKTEFYDFIKIDKNHKYNHGDFSAANGECLTAEERIEFLKAYSDFLDKKTDMICRKKPFRTKRRKGLRRL